MQMNWATQQTALSEAARIGSVMLGYRRGRRGRGREQESKPVTCVSAINLKDKVTKPVVFDRSCKVNVRYVELIRRKCFHLSV